MQQPPGEETHGDEQPGSTGDGARTVGEEGGGDRAVERSTVPTPQQSRDDAFVTPGRPTEAAGRERARQQAFLETHDSGLERAAGIADGGQVPPSQSVGFMTPRSTVSIPSGTTWLGGVEVPRWMARLGSYLNLGSITDPLFPSPLAGSISGESPPGGRAFTLRTPTRAERLPRPMTPSSSSIPAEAIQLEVQRQLGGILSRLQTAEAENERLRNDLQRAQQREHVPEGFNSFLPVLPQRTNDMIDDSVQVRDGTVGTPAFGSATGGLFAGVAPIFGGPTTSGQAGSLFGNLVTTPSGPGQLFESAVHTALPITGSAVQTALPITGSAVQTALPTTGSAVHTALPTTGSAVQTALPTTGSAVHTAGPAMFTSSITPSGQQQASPSAPMSTSNMLDGSSRRAAVEGTQGDGFLRSLLAPRSRSPTPPPANPSTPESPVIDMLARSIQQLQDLQAQALSKSGNGSGAEQVKPGTTTLAQLPDPRGGCEAALQFQDWIEVASSILSDVSEQSGQWWRELISLVESTYSRWLAATPLERLQIAPVGSEALTTGRWTRLNARVSSMLLSAMGEALRSDMVSQRLTQDSVRMVFRMFTTFQPGGSAERQDILKRLQSPQDYVTGDSVEASLAAVRAWPRWLARCRAVNMAFPDPSVLARGLMSVSSKHINQSPDAAFRTSMLRTSLRIDAQPSLEQVVGYQRHIQAELETIAGASTATSPATPGVRALDKVSSPKGREKNNKDTELCRYFMKPSGCKRGARCAYAHNMSTLDREARSKKCLQCGSESHRARDCPVAKPPKGGSSTASPSKDQRGALQPEPKAVPVTPSVASAATPTDGSQAPVQGTPWTLETLVQAAQQIVQAHGQDARDDKSPEKTRAEMKTLVVKDIRISSLHSSSSALLDSGATHNLRSAYDQAEWERAQDVVVQLARSNKLTMKMSSAGTLLMPPKTRTPGTTEASTTGQTIVSMGELVRTLGYTLMWAPEKCVLCTPQGEELSLKVHGGCPQLCEAEALALIARLEERKKERLLNEVTTTQDRVELAAMSMDRTWMDHLQEFVVSGSKEAGLRSVRDASFLQGLPGECVDGLFQPGVREQGWGVMKNIDFLTRAQKRYLWGAKKWVVHLFAGDQGHWQMFRLDQGSTAVLELDIQRCKGHDVLNNSTWRLLLWGALTGRIDAVVGGPPARNGVIQPAGKDGPESMRSMKLITRMMWLFALAQTARQSRKDVQNQHRPVAFMIEHPAKEATMRTSIWTTDLWNEFKNEMDMMEVTFNQQATGGGNVPTTVGTNVYYLLGLDKLGQEEQDEQREKDSDSGVWSPGFVDAVVLALTFWDRHPRRCPILASMSPEQWRRHVQSNHADYHRDCLTCVMARGTGRRHARVRHPDMFNLTVDLAGPHPGGEDKSNPPPVPFAPNRPPRTDPLVVMGLVNHLPPAPPEDVVEFFPDLP